MSARVDVMYALLTDEWQSSAEIADKMIADGWFRRRPEALSAIWEQLSKGEKYGLCERMSFGVPNPTLWRRKA